VAPDHDDLKPRAHAATASQRWRAVGGQCFEWRDWGGDVVVYVEGTASTHHLSPAAGGVLTALLASAESPSLEELFCRLFTGDTPMAPHEESALHAILLDLQQMGLVTREAP
jgi:hypothetical protein